MTTKVHSSSASRNEWWQRSVARRTVSFVEQDVAQVASYSPFLNSKPAHHESVALFRRHEIIKGRLLGKGGFSNVYEVIGFDLDEAVSCQLSPSQQKLREHYQRTSRTPEGEGRYAVKHLKEKLLSTPKEFQYAASDLAIEASYLSALDHPNILSVRGLPVDGIHGFADGRHDGFFIITDRLTDTLDARIGSWRSCGVDLAHKAEYALQLADALDYLADRRIVFRDLKPHNIGFDRSGLLQLFDFGLCRELPEGESDELFCMSGVGTRRYMAPEVCTVGNYNEKADVYSWSMVLWEMLSSIKPYPDYSVNDHQRFVCERGERPDMNPEWPRSIQNLLRQTWTEDVASRLSMKETRFLLKAIIQATKITAESPESPVSVQDSTFRLFGPPPSYLELPLLPIDDTFQRMSISSVGGLSEASEILSESSLLGMTMSSYTVEPTTYLE